MEQKKNEHSFRKLNYIKVLDKLLLSLSQMFIKLWKLIYETGKINF
jgi:hypothetical protein